MAENKLAKIIKTRRTSLIDLQQRIQDFVKNKLSTASIHEVDLRLQALDKYFNNFENIQSAIEDLDESREALDIHDNFEELCFMLHPVFSDSIDRFKHENANKTFSSSTGSSSLKLPKISLPFFTGDYTQWITYFQTFTSLVHKNHALDDVTLFHYLRSSLKEGALRRIESVEVTIEKYQVALQLLIDRYQKKHLLQESTLGT